MTDNVTVFDQYSITASPQPASEQDNRPAYQAIGLDKTKNRQTRFRCHYPDGTVDVFSYAHLLEISCTDQQHLLLCFSNCILSLEGMQIEELIEPLQDEKVRFLACFKPDYYAPLEEGQPVIQTITRQSVFEVAGR